MTDIERQTHQIRKCREKKTTFEIECLPLIATIVIIVASFQFSKTSRSNMRR